MAENKNQTPDPKTETLTYVRQVEPEVKAPPVLATGALLWIRQNLISSPTNAALTLIGIALIYLTIQGVSVWMVTQANWYSISFNLRQFMLGRFESEYEWRTSITILFSVFFMAAAVAIWVKQIARVMFVTIVIIAIALLVVPTLIINTLDLPTFYMVAGNTDIIAGTTTETPIDRIAFIGREGETVTIQMADELLADDEALATISGFVDRPANTLRNAATNRLAAIDNFNWLVDQLEQDASSDIPIITAGQREAYTAERDAFVEPQAVVELYNVSGVTIEISILDGETFQPIAEPVLLRSSENVFEATLNKEGWFILEKTLVGGDGSTLLNVQGIYPVLKSNVFSSEAGGFVDTFVRMTDTYRETDLLPEIDGEAMPFVVVTQNQYRGTRPLADYLRGYIAPFFQNIGIHTSIVMAFAIAGYFITIFIQNSQGSEVATRFAAIGFGLIPILFWIFINGMFAISAVMWLMVLSIAFFILLVYQLGRQNGMTATTFAIPVTAYLAVVFVLWQTSLITDMPFDFPQYLKIYTLAIEPAGMPRFLLWISIALLLTAAYLGASLHVPDDETKPNWLIWGGLALVLFVISAGLALSNTVTIDTQWPLQPSDPRNWGGFLLVMALTIYGIIIAFPIGVGLALGRRSDLPAIRYLCTAYIELVRGSPFITVLFFVQLFIPLLNQELAEVTNSYRAIIATIAFSAAYLAENVRGGLQSLPPGQNEAAKAIGLSAWQATMLITLPQALRAVIPALVGQFIGLFKDTSLVSIVGLIDLVGIVNAVVVQTEFIGTRLEGLLFISIIYFVVSYVMSYISRLLEASGSGSTRRM
jgi:general L-amino acid transport system permease protein